MANIVKIVWMCASCVFLKCKCIAIVKPVLASSHLISYRAVAKGLVGQVMAGPTFKHFSIKWAWLCMVGVASCGGCGTKNSNAPATFSSM